MSSDYGSLEMHKLIKTIDTFENISDVMGSILMNKKWMETFFFHLKKSIIYCVNIYAVIVMFVDGL